MMADLTPAEWRERLLHELGRRRPDIDRLTAYYRGEHPLPWAPKEVREAYRAFLRMSRSNWCRLVVKAPAERLRVVGLRFSQDAGGDVDAWTRYWQGNNLDLHSRQVHDAALITRRGFVLVWPSDEPDQAPSITAETPSQVIVGYEPGGRERLAALKTFTDPVAKLRYATVWTRDEVGNFKAPYEPGTGSTQARWEPWEDSEQGIVAEANNVVGRVPVVEFQSDPALTGEPMGELDGGVTDIQDRINKTVLDRLVTSNFASFRQKWATGLDIPQDENGNDIEPFKVAVNRLFVSENPDTKFGEFSESDLAGYIKSAEADIQHLAAITRTPPHYLLGQSGAFPSGESLKATETGLVAKVTERRDSFTESWEDVMRLALRIDGDSRADDMALSMVWKDPESRSVAEVVDAATKLASIGVPWRSVMEFIGYSPNEIERMDQQRAEDVADGMLAALTATPPAPPAAANPMVAR
jgi:hypothetical protein